MIAEPRSGPATVAMPKTPDRSPVIRARVSGGKETATIAIPTGKKPPLPNPWTARKAMSSGSDWLSPASIEPAMKTARPPRKTFRRLQRSESFPKIGIATVEAMM